MDSNNQDGTLAVTVTQTATVPLSPVVEAVIAALPKATDQQVETYIEENFQRLLDCSFEMSEYEDDISSIVEQYVDSNFSHYLERCFDIREYLDINDYCDEVIEMLEGSTELFTQRDFRETEVIIEKLEARVEQLEYALRKMGEALSGLGGDQ